jgi:CDP-glucose 4,6-dehydratase
VLVTGANGFIGRWLVRALAARGASVHALIHSRSELVKNDFGDEVKVVSSDITNLEEVLGLLRDSKIDLVYHLAAINTNTGSAISPYDIFECNTRGTYTILEACRRTPQPVHAVISSSKEVEDCFRPGNGRKHHPYMASKAAAELIAKTYFDTAGVPAAVVRLDNIYGGGDFNWNRLVPGMMRVILQSEVPVIRSSGLLQRDYVYVEDAVAAFLAIGERLEKPDVQGQLFRVTTGIGTSVLEMVKQIGVAAGRPDLKPQVLNEKSEERIDSFYQPELEKKILGWSSQTSLREGLTRTCAWYQAWFQKK